MARQLEIRNSTAEFLTFVIEGKEDGIQVEIGMRLSGRRIRRSCLII